MRAQRAKTKGVGSGQTSLFGSVAEAYSPRVYTCQFCGLPANYGLGWPVVTPDQWFCRQHIPAGFLPQQRSAEAHAT